MVLAAGKGSRLAPLTRHRPKPLCPVGTRPLIDHALDRISPWVGAVAVNLHHRGEMIDAHLLPHVHRSWERPVALGTAGALGALKGWLDGRDVLLTNSDAWFSDGLDLHQMVTDWDRQRTRLLTVRSTGGGDFGDHSYCGVALIPWSTIEGLQATPSGLYEVSWGHEHQAGRLDVVSTGAAFVDCGTPGDYLAANLAHSRGRSVIDPMAEVDPSATVESSVIWEGAVVDAGEVLVRAVRTAAITLLIR